MKDAVYDRTTALFDIGGYVFKTTGSVLKFDGYKKVYNIEDKEETQRLPDLKRERQ